MLLAGKRRWITAAVIFIPLWSGLWTRPDQSGLMEAHAAPLIFPVTAEVEERVPRPAPIAGKAIVLRTDSSQVPAAYLQFNVQSLSAPVARAMLEIYATKAQRAGFAVHALTNSTWRETATSGAITPGFAPMVIGSSGSVAAGTWTSIDVTSLVTGNGTVSMAVTTRTGIPLVFARRESSHAPRLLITALGARKRATSTNTPTPAPAATPTNTPTSLPAATPTNTISPLPTATPVNTLLPTVTPTSTPLDPPQWTTYYVDPNGNDGNNGTSPSTPWQTIGKLNAMMASFQPGDQILLKRGGVWTSQLIIQTTGTGATPIRFGAYGTGANPLISIAGSGSGLNINASAYTIVDSINAQGPGLSQVGISQDATIYLHGDSHDVTISNLTGSYATDSGVSATSNTRNITFDHVTAHDNVQTGIYMDSQGGTITHCKSYNNGTASTSYSDQGGIGVYQGGNITISHNEVYSNGLASDNTDFEISVVSPAAAVTIVRNYVHDAGEGGIQVAEGGNGSVVAYNIIDGFGTTSLSGLSWGKAAAIRIGGGVSGGGVEVANNVIANGGPSPYAFGIAVTFPESSSTTVKNNIFYDNACPDVAVDSNVTLTAGQIDKNDYFQSSYADAWDWQGTYYSSLHSWTAATGEDTSSLTSNPLFVSPSSADYDLQAGSPDINQATNLGFTSDYHDNPVPVGAGPDIGAAEYQ